VNSTGVLYAYEALTGTLLWTTGVNYTAPLAFVGPASSIAIVGSTSSGTVIGLHAATGAVAWTYSGLQAPVTTVLVTPDNLTLYLTSGDSVACVGVVDGSEAWTAALDSDVVTVTLGAGPTPTLFVTSAAGTVYAFKG
jgi:outer membrane protein assembly factor BamB